MKKNIIILFGGKSVEHDISILTALQAYSSLDRLQYNIYPIYIDKQNQWKYLKHFKLDTLKNYKHKKHSTVIFKTGSNILLKTNLLGYSKMASIDVALLCTHGKYGEDGCLQGMLECCGIAYTGTSVLGSAIGMDKIVMKDIFKANNIPCVEYKSFSRFDYEINCKNICDAIKNELKFPVIVKPANLGSSIGINICKNVTELKKGIKVAMLYDDRIIVEKFVQNPIEINCAVLGEERHFELSELEQPITNNKLLNFEDKYLAQTKYTNNKKIDISDEYKEQVKDLSKRIFKTFNCSGVVRIDYLIDTKKKKVYANEINTIPGSLSSHMFSKNYNYIEYINMLIKIAEDKCRAQKEIITFFNSSVLNDFCGKYKK